jgi:hypothetical protein
MVTNPVHLQVQLHFAHHMEDLLHHKVTSACFADCISLLLDFLIILVFNKYYDMGYMCLCIEIIEIHVAI